MRASSPGSSPATTRPPRKERIVSPAADERDPQGGALHQLRLLRLRVQLDGVRPEFLGPAALAKGMRFVGDARDRPTVERLERLQRRARDLGLHALLLLQRALPEGRRPARRDRQARRRVDQGRHRPRHGREAREVVRHARRETTGWLRETELVPKTQGVVDGDQADRVRAQPARSTARCRRRSRRTWREDVQEARALLRPRQGRRGASGALGIVQGEHALGQHRVHEESGRARTRRRSSPEWSRRTRGMRRSPTTRAASRRSRPKELDTSTKALAPKLGLELDELESVTCCGAGDIHEAEPDYYLHLNARILAYAEATGRRHADDDLQRLHAQPAPGELAAQERRRRCARG